MTYKMTIPGKLPGLNAYTEANRRNRFKGAKMKQEIEDYISWQIRMQLKGVVVEKPCVMRYKFFEADKRRDWDNVVSCAVKFTQDALVKSGVLKGDGQKWVTAWYPEYGISKEHPRIEVEIEEVDDGERTMGRA